MKENINNGRLERFSNMYNELVKSINPFDILSGKVVIQPGGIFWFKDAGYNIGEYNFPMLKNLYREGNKPCAISNYGLIAYNSGVGVPVDVVYDYVDDKFEKPMTGPMQDFARTVYKLIPE